MVPNDLKLSDGQGEDKRGKTEKTLPPCPFAGARG